MDDNFDPWAARDLHIDPEAPEMIPNQAPGLSIQLRRRVVLEYHLQMDDGAPSLIWAGHGIFAKADRGFRCIAN